MVRVSVLYDAQRCMYNAEKRVKASNHDHNFLKSCHQVSPRHAEAGTGKVMVELNGRLHKWEIICLRFDVGVKAIEPCTERLFPSRQLISIVLPTSAVIMDHEEACRKM